MMPLLRANFQVTDLVADGLVVSAAIDDAGSSDWLFEPQTTRTPS